MTVYGIAANSFSSVAGLYNAGYVDFVIVSSTGSYPPSGFIDMCNSVGASSILQNSDSGSGGCSGDCNSYYASLASSGLMAVGGESEQAAEAEAIMANLIFMTYGGEGTGGAGDGNDVIWGTQYGPARASGHGASAWLETYTASSMISASALGTDAGINKDDGCFEVGILIGSWAQNDYGADQNTYAEIADEYKSHGVTNAGFQYWYVGGDGAGFSNGIMSALMGTYPPTKTNIKARAGGGPGPSPGPTPAPTPSGTANNVFLNARMRTYQAGYD